jgi:hypothetical protein
MTTQIKTWSASLFLALGLVGCTAPVAQTNDPNGTNAAITIHGASGESCELDLQCASGLVCRPSCVTPSDPGCATGLRYECQTPGAVGALCGKDTECASGLSCVGSQIDDGSAGTCGVPPNGTVSAVFLTSSNEPYVGATVRYVSDSGAIATELTSDQGAIVESLAQGAYTFELVFADHNQPVGAVYVTSGNETDVSYTCDGGTDPCTTN